MTDSTSFDTKKPRSVGQILDGALELYQAYPLLFAVLALGVVAPYQLVVLAVTGEAPLGDQSFVLGLSLTTITAVLISPLISALHIHAVVTIGKGETPRLRAVARRGVAVLPVVAATDIMAGLGVAAGLVLLIVPGVILGLRWAVAAQVAAIDHEGWLPALRRSRALTAGNYGHIFGLSFLVGLINSIALIVPSALIGSSASAPNVAIGIAVFTLTASFSAITTAVLYFDLVARSTAPPAADAA